MNTYETHNIIKTSVLPIIFHMDVVRNTKVNPHRHENIEFLCCFEGNGIVFSDSTEIEMNEGDTIIINSKHIHSIIAEKNVKYYCLIIDRSFFLENGVDIDSLNFREKITDKHITELMVNILNSYTDISSPFYIVQNKTALGAFITYIAKNYSYKVNSVTPISKSHSAIMTAIDYIHNNYAAKLSIDEISSNSGYSKYHFVRIFKEITTCTIVEYINATRCEKAKALLLETSDPVSEICSACGFDYPSYFSKIFKRHYNCSPSEFRTKYSKLK